MVATRSLLLPVVVMVVVLAVAVCVADDSAPVPVRHRRVGHLPKSRSQLHREQEAREKRRHQAEVLEAQAEQLRKAAVRRKREWKQERLRKFKAFQEKERAQELEEKKKEAAEMLAEQKAKQQAEQQQSAQRKHRPGYRPDAPEEDSLAANRGTAPGTETIVGGRLDCFGVPGGGARRDACGVCGGDDSSCADCLGVPHGNATEDCAGVCNGQDRSCVDCAGVMNGDTEVDQCDVCGGDGTSCLDCLGVVKGTATVDVCGVCDGDGTSCADCRGVANGPARLDPCGICEGDGSSCCSPFSEGGSGSDETRMSDPNATPALCTGHGTCSYQHHFCVCDRGWTGPFCTVRQNLCLQHQGQGESEADMCNGRGECDPDTGMCRCAEPEQWVGPRCEFSRCNRRGAYDLSSGRCKCQHGYGGQFCERCAAVRPRPGRLHVCVQMLGAWQSVPEDLKLAKSILLGEENPRAPVFALMDADTEAAQAYVAGGSFLNQAGAARGHKSHRHRDAIWPNSTHPASGYYYDCGCRLAAAPPVAPTDPDALQDQAQGDAAVERQQQHQQEPGTSTALAVLPARSYRPQFPGQASVGKWLANRARVQRELAERAPATLPECQNLLQEVLDEFGFAIDAATAEVSELASAIGEVNSTCASEATFGIAWFLIAMLVAIVVALLTVLCIWGARRYVTIRGPFEEL